VSALKIAIPTRSLGLPLRRGLAAASQTGADGVELDLRTELPLAEVTQTASRELRKIADDHGLRIAIATYPVRRGFDDPSELDRRIEATQRAMGAAYQLGARVLVTRLLQLPATGEPHYSTLVESLEILASAADRSGVALALEWGGEAEPLVEVLQQVGGGTLGVSFDPGQLVAQSRSPQGALEVIAPHLQHVRATDAVRDLRHGGVVEVELGRGSVDYDQLAGGLSGIDYRGWVTAGRGESHYPLEQLTSAVSYLRNVTD
jgi:sugar phosphate isomerase/epimerase